MSRMPLWLPFVFFSVFFSLNAFAQNELNVPDITVLGTSGKSTLDVVPTVSELSGQRLQRKKRATVGETLANEAGVTSSYFGPNASRPIIRGLEGDRIRVLQNGTGVLDASAASQDHAVASDTLNVERIEIVRGPAALLYGSNAVGGVVNLITRRIPEKLPPKTEGQAETRYSTTDNGRAGALSLDTGFGAWAIHGDGSLRAADDYHGPKRERAYNSFNRTGEAALGTSYIFSKGFVGGAVSNYESTYGTVAERFVHINMLQQRFDLTGEVRDLGWIKSVRAKNSYSHYKHDEIEEGSRGTTFKNDGDEARVEVKHQAVAGFSGMIGSQYNTFDFSAQGDESFLPSTQNENFAVFLFEEKESGKFKPSFGLRADQNRVASKTDANFGPGVSRHFTGGSASLGFLFQVSEKNSITLNTAYTERAPNYEELFANGPHVATQVFEVGDHDLKKEQGQSAELSFRHKGEQAEARMAAFIQDFHNFISLTPSGTDDAGSGLPIYNYLSVDARLYGAELEYRHKLPRLIPGGTLELETKVDMVRGINRSSGESLARITPLRETVALIYKTNRYQADIEAQRSERQSQTAAFESETKSYTFLNLGLEVPVTTEWANFSIAARANNIFDPEGRNHASVIKDLAPLPGRNFILGVQAQF